MAPEADDSWSTVPSPKRKAQVCFSHLSGACSRGAACPRLHLSLAQAAKCFVPPDPSVPAPPANGGGKGGGKGSGRATGALKADRLADESPTKRKTVTWADINALSAKIDKLKATKPPPPAADDLVAPVVWTCQCGVGHSNPRCRACRVCKLPRSPKDGKPAAEAAAREDAAAKGT